jgi:hypothetical protein
MDGVFKQNAGCKFGLPNYDDIKEDNLEEF